MKYQKTTTNRVREYGQLKKLSVAILVDGKYIIDQEGKKQYQERSPEEINKIKSLAVSAIGIDEDRGDKIEVLNLQFIDLIEPDQESFNILEFLKTDAKGIMQVIVIGIVAVLVLYIVVKPMVSKVTTEEAYEGEDVEQNVALNKEVEQQEKVTDKLSDVIKKDTDSGCFNN